MGAKPEGAVKVGVFSGCAQDFVYPGQLMDAVKLLQSKGAGLSFPMEQSCCGLPLQMMGQRAAAIKTAKANVDAFDKIEVDHIMTLCASCANHMREHYEELTSDDPSYKAKTQKYLSKIIDFSSLAKNKLGFTKDDFNNGGEKVAYHSPCHLCRGLVEVTKEPRELIAMAGEYVVSPEEDVCCGFGGTYSLKFPEISGTLLAHKLDGVEEAGAEILVTDCPGCVMQLRGGEDKRGNKVKVEHMSEFLARNAKKK